MSDARGTNPTPVVSAGRPRAASPDTLSAEELAVLRQRLAQHFYDQPEVVALIAAAVQPDVEGCQRD
jgi:hypothetical protein